MGGGSAVAAAAAAVCGATRARTLLTRTTSLAWGAATTTSSKDLLIVGPGVLGRLVAAQWREAHPTARIVGETSTKDNHDALRALGIEPRDREEGMAVDESIIWFKAC